MKFLRKSWPIWAIWLGLILFLTGLAINPFWTFVGVWIGIMGTVIIRSIRAAIAMSRED